MPLSSLTSHPPAAVSAVLSARDWPALGALLEGGFPANAAWLAEGSLFEMFCLAASAPIPIPDSVEHRQQQDVVRQFVAAGLANRAPFGADRPFSLPLTISALLGRRDLVEQLMLAGHHPDALNCPHSLPPLNVMCEVHSPFAGEPVPQRAPKADVVRALLRGGADIEAEGSHRYRPLQQAVRQGDTETVLALLEGGAEVDGALMALSFDPGPQWSPLAWAVYHDRAVCCQTLLGAGANPFLSMGPGQSIVECAGVWAGPDTWRALVQAVGLAHPEVTRGWFQAIQANKPALLMWFLTAGMDVSVLTEQGWGGLDVAAQANAMDAYRWLLIAGLDPDQRRADGKTASERLSPQTQGRRPHLVWDNPAEPAP